MKHFLLLCASLLMLVSCGQPKFEFSLNTDGNVADRGGTEIVADFTAQVANVSEDYVVREFTNCEFVSLESRQAVRVNKWLDDFVKSEILRDSDEVNYDITLKGYVKECSTGLKFEVDKTWRK